MLTIEFPDNIRLMNLDPCEQFVIIYYSNKLSCFNIDEILRSEPNLAPIFNFELTSADYISISTCEALVLVYILANNSLRIVNFNKSKGDFSSEVFEGYMGYDLLPNTTLALATKDELFISKYEDKRLTKLKSFTWKTILNENKDFRVECIKVIPDFIFITLLIEKEEKEDLDEPESIANIDQVFYFIKYTLSETGDFNIDDVIYKSDDLLPLYSQYEFKSQKPRYLINFFKE
jgi:hypothetical protein